MVESKREMGSQFCTFPICVVGEKRIFVLHPIPVPIPVPGPIPGRAGPALPGFLSDIIFAMWNIMLVVYGVCTRSR